MNLTHNKKLKKFLLPILMMILVIALMSACGKKEADQQTEVVNQSEGNQTEAPKTNEELVTEATAFPVTFSDANGTMITIEEQPERIVSLMPSNTEIAYALGVGDLVVGVNDYDTYPPEVVEKEKIGGMQFNIEKIISLKPDVVLAHASTQSGLEQLTDAGVTVVVIQDATSIAEVYVAIEMIATATGTVEKGDQIVAEMKETFASYASKASMIKEEERALVWVEVDTTLFTTGKGTFMHEMLENLNAKNAAGDQEGWVQFTEEEVVALNPDVIITTYGGYIENPEQIVYDRQAWQGINAVVNKLVFDVDADSVTRSGPRLAKGIEELAKAIYPEVFAK